jgi:hypothetical protein
LQRGLSKSCFFRANLRIRVNVRSRANIRFRARPDLTAGAVFSSGPSDFDEVASRPVFSSVFEPSGLEVGSKWFRSGLNAGFDGRCGVSERSCL